MLLQAIFFYYRKTQSALSQSTGEPAEDNKACEPYMEKAKQELNYSDKIIYGDLLRFYDEMKNGKDEKETQEETNK